MLSFLNPSCGWSSEQALAALVRSLHGDPDLKTFFLAAQKSVAQKAGRKMINRLERIGVLRDDRILLPELLGRCRETPQRLERAARLSYFDQEPHGQILTSGVEESACPRRGYKISGHFSKNTHPLFLRAGEPV